MRNRYSSGAPGTHVSPRAEQTPPPDKAEIVLSHNNIKASGTSATRQFIFNVDGTVRVIPYNVPSIENVVPIFSAAEGAILSANKVLNNNDFSGYTGWARGVGWVYNGDSISCNGSQTALSILSQTCAGIVGSRAYIAEVNIEEILAGSIGIYISGMIYFSAKPLTVGFNRVLFTPEETAGYNSNYLTNGSVYLRADADFIGTIKQRAPGEPAVAVYEIESYFMVPENLTPVERIKTPYGVAATYAEKPCLITADSYTSKSPTNTFPGSLQSWINASTAGGTLSYPAPNPDGSFNSTLFPKCGAVVADAVNAQAFVTAAISVVGGRTYVVAVNIEEVYSGSLQAQRVFATSGVTNTKYWPVCSANPSGGSTGVIQAGQLIVIVRVATTGTLTFGFGAGAYFTLTAKIRFSGPVVLLLGPTADLRANYAQISHCPPVLNGSSSEQFISRVHSFCKPNMEAFRPSELGITSEIIYGEVCAVPLTTGQSNGHVFSAGDKAGYACYQVVASPTAISFEARDNLGAILFSASFPYIHTALVEFVARFFYDYAEGLMGISVDGGAWQTAVVSSPSGLIGVADDRARVSIGSGGDNAEASLFLGRYELGRTKVYKDRQQSIVHGGWSDLP